MKGKQVLTVLGALCLLLVGAAAVWDKGEGRVPEFSLKSLASGELAYRFDRMFLRGFPGRERMLELSQDVDVLLGKTARRGIFVTNRGLIQVVGEPTEEETSRKIGYIRDFSSCLPNTEVFLMLVPGKEELYRELVGNQSLIWNEKEYIDRIIAELSPYVYEVDAYTELSLHKDEYLFYRTDTRWTMNGAYRAFSELAGKLRVTDREYDSFDVEYVTDAFYGNLYKKARYRGIEPDVIGLYHYNYDVRFNKVVYHSGDAIVEDANLYRYEYLDTDNPYGVFFGDEFAVFDLLTRRQSAKSILLVGDDLVNSIAPFLIPSYAKITCVNLPRLSEPLSSAVDLESYDQVVVLESMAQFCTDANGLDKLLT